jgi:hypothetical protein
MSRVGAEACQRLSLPSSARIAEPGLTPSMKHSISSAHHLELQPPTQSRTSACALSPDIAIFPSNVFSGAGTALEAAVIVYAADFTPRPVFTGCDALIRRYFLPLPLPPELPSAP